MKAITEIRTQFQTLADELSHPLLAQFLADLEAEVRAELKPYATVRDVGIKISRYPLGIRLIFNCTALGYDQVLEHPDACPTASTLGFDISEVFTWGELPIHVAAPVVTDLPSDVIGLLVSLGKIRSEVSTYNYVQC